MASETEVLGVGLTLLQQFDGLIKAVSPQQMGHARRPSYEPDVEFASDAAQEDIEKFVEIACKAAHIADEDIPIYVAAAQKKHHLTGLSVLDFRDAASALQDLSLSMQKGKVK